MKPSPSDKFHFLLAIVLFLVVAEDIASDAWQVQSLLLFQGRHPPFMPWFPAPYLLLEWAAIVGSGVFILIGKGRPFGFWLGFAGSLASISQRFSNHRFLLTLVLFYLAFLPESESRRMIRYQLVIVYFFSVVNKLLHGFYTGESLAVLNRVATFSILPNALMGKTLACAVLAIELAIPFLLWRRPRLGFTLLVVFHGALLLQLPEVLSFSLLMIALGLLFFEPAGSLIHTQ